MEKKDAVITGAALLTAVVVVVGAVSVGDKVVVSVPTRTKADTYETREFVGVYQADGGVSLDLSGAEVVGEVEVKKCDVGTAAFCLQSADRKGASKCVKPVDSTCRRKHVTPSGADAGWRFAGTGNVFKASDAEPGGNCAEAPCVILYGDRAP